MSDIKKEEIKKEERPTIKEGEVPLDEIGNFEELSAGAFQEAREMVNKGLAKEREELDEDGNFRMVIIRLKDNKPIYVFDERYKEFSVQQDSMRNIGKKFN